jgi:SPP1 gp7 family putative phage head morphogenesis protein
MKQYKPVKVKNKNIKEFENKLIEFFKSLMFFYKDDKPVKNFENSKNDLIKAIQDGRIRYDNGKFYGKFNAKISKTLSSYGAKYNKITNSYNLSIDLIPQDIQIALSVSDTLFSAYYTKIVNELANINVDDALEVFSFETEYIKSLSDVDKQVYQSLKKDITITPDYTEGTKERLAKNFNENLKLTVKSFAEDEILKLREKVQESFDKGMRAKELSKVIQKEFNTTVKKANFLARQELSLITSKYKQDRYEVAGITKYKWSTSQDERVRDSHKELNGRIFSFDDPPIVDDKTGARANPGEYYNCRCVAIPIIE